MTSQALPARIVFEDNRLVPLLYGEQNENLGRIEKALNVNIGSRGNELLIDGAAPDIARARQVLDALWAKLLQGQEVDGPVIDAALRFLMKQPREGQEAPVLEGFVNNPNQIVTKKRRIQPRTPLQAEYIRAMYENPLVFGRGPAGTGKTYLAIAMAVAMLEEGRIERIILSRPAVEAGERIGFLPGEMKEKMDPYMRPLYDALQDTMAGDKVVKKIASEEIEIAPLAFMRGRSLNNAFIILDEAQNTTTMQMMMFLTRMGQNARMVVTGDPGQIDLPKGQKSGIVDAWETLDGVEGIKFIRFSKDDVVRSAIVGRIIDAYDRKKGTGTAT